QHGGCMSEAKTQLLAARVNDEELAAAETLILSLNARSAQKFGAAIAFRLAEHAPFATVSDFLRVVVGFDPLRDESDAATGRPRHEMPTKAALHARASRGDQEARRTLNAMGVKRRNKL